MKKRNSKTVGSNSDNSSEFRGLLDDLKKDIKDMIKGYLHPILEVNNKIADQLCDLQFKIKKNEESIGNCQLKIDELRRSNA